LGKYTGFSIIVNWCYDHELFERATSKHRIAFDR
jgi:hypothetical protein